MNERNNGKIVIAIVAMVAVAASIIGFTYAYFTAAFTQNTKDQTVEVTAGKLMAKYENGNDISAINVVPGWISNNLTYYNVDKIQDGKIMTSSLADETGTGGAYASGSDLLTALTANPWEKEADVVKSYRNMGLTAPLTFSVSNISEEADIGDKIYYYIRLNIETNGVREFDFDEYESDEKARLEANRDPAAATYALTTEQKEDYKNVYVSLYRGEFTQANANAENFGATKIFGPEVLGAKTQDGTPAQIVVSAPEEIALSATPEDNTKKYFLVLEYKNKDFTQVVQNVAIKLSVEVVGGQYNEAGAFVDADNNVIFNAPQGS